MSAPENQNQPQNLTEAAMGEFSSADEKPPHFLKGWIHDETERRLAAQAAAPEPTFTASQIDAGLDAWFADPNWRTVFALHPVRKYMQASLAAAAKAAPTSNDSDLREAAKNLADLAQSHGCDGQQPLLFQNAIAAVRAALSAK